MERSLVPASFVQHRKRGFYCRVRRKAGEISARLKEEAKKLLAKAVYSLPGLSRFNLRNKLVAFSRYCVRINGFPAANSLAGKDWYLALRPSEVIRRKPPISPDEKGLALFRRGAALCNQGEEFRLPEVFLAAVNNVQIYSSDCLVMSEDRSRLYVESALSRGDILDANGIFDVILWPSPKIVRGEYCLLTCSCADKNYSEWLLGNLPRLSLIEQFPELKSVRFIVPRSLKPYQRDSLQMAGIPAERLVPFDDGLWQVDKLYFAELPSPLGNPSPHAVSWLRSKFLNSATPRSRDAKRLLYVTRRDASQRRVLNEEEIVAYLKGVGFEVICPSDYSFSEQIEIFRGAEVVVGPHGAAFANMVFAPAGATLIEFFGDNYLHGCYWALASICDQKHRFLVGPSQWLDYTISLDDLKVTLAQSCGI